MQNVVKSHFFVPASADDLTLGVDVTIPVSNATAIVHILHGMCEHKERYHDFMMFLSSQGYICVCHDHRGHGESIKSRMDLGYMYDGGADALVEDVRTVIHQQVPVHHVEILNIWIVMMIVNHAVK